MPLPYRGTRVYFDGKNYSVPALAVMDFEASIDTLTKVYEPGTESVKQRFAELIPIIGLAIRRNYPEVTDDYLRNKLDMDTFKECLEAMNGHSGMREAEPGEA